MQYFVCTILRAACHHQSAVFQDAGHLIPLERPTQRTATLLGFTARL